MTEEEAKTKWCPFTRVDRVVEIHPGAGAYSLERVSYNRLQGAKGGIVPQQSTLCLGSACMAWRWFDDLSDDGTACHHKPSAKFARVPEPQQRSLSERRGYCGLAGQP